MRSVLLEWAVKTQKLKSADRTLPKCKGKEFKEFVYREPCIVFRKELSGEQLSKLEKDWKPGKDTWIAERSIHNALFQWLETHNLVDKKAKDIEAVLSETPPKVLNKRGESGEIIRRVRVARSMTDSYLEIANSYVQPGNNHHFVLFHNGKEGKERRKTTHNGNDAGGGKTCQCQEAGRC